MKKNTRVHYLEALQILRDLSKAFPSYNMGRHLATALDQYSDVWGVTDKELVYALKIYKTQLELDEPHLQQDEDLSDIIRGGMNLTLIDEDEYLEKE